jgi:hypothetical protein
MSGKYNKGTLVFVNAFPQKIYENDVITFEYKNNIITHFVAKIEDGYIITKSRSGVIDDMKITKENIIGKVVFGLPNEIVIALLIVLGTAANTIIILFFWKEFVTKPIIQANNNPINII